MKITTSVDFGDEIVPADEIKITMNLSFKLGDVMMIPNIRETLIQTLLPLLKNLQMSEKELQNWKNAIRYSQDLYQILPYPYYMSKGSRFIKNFKDKEANYTIQDLLEGKVPDISVENLNLV